MADSKGKELTTIGKAHEYVKEYTQNGYHQINAYIKSHGCSYDAAADQAYRFHKSPAAQEAFQVMIGSTVNEYFKTRDGVVLEAQALLNQAREESLDTALKCLKFIAELMGHVKIVNGGKTINNDNRSINISNLDIKELKSIVGDLQKMNKDIAADNGRQTGEVN